MNTTDFLKVLCDAAIAAAQPSVCLPAHLPEPPKGRTIVVGAGKASAAMAAAVEANWTGKVEGLVLTRYGHGVPCTKIEIVEAEASPKLLLDFGNVEHLSSAALGVLITLNKQVLEHQGQLVLAHIHPQIYEVFKITRLNKLFNIQNSTPKAMEEFKG